MASYSVDIPDSAKEVDGMSTVKQLQNLYKLQDKAEKKGKLAVVVDAREIKSYPGYTCTHYAAGALNALVLLVKEVSA